MRDENLYLQDIVEAVAEIQSCLKGVSKEAFLANSVLEGNVSYRLLIIGESASKLSGGFRDAHSEVEWAKVVALRNIVAHSYFAVDWNLLWNIATIDAPTLGAQVEHILAEEFPEAES